MVKRLLGDSNFNVILTVLKLTGLLAKGLRRNFNHSAKLLFPHIIPKLRDKKNQMVE
jgi:cytoskeleton-associated protein 5